MSQNNMSQNNMNQNGNMNHPMGMPVNQQPVLPAPTDWSAFLYVTNSQVGPWVHLRDGRVLPYYDWAYGPLVQLPDGRILRRIDWVYEFIQSNPNMAQFITEYPHLRGTALHRDHVARYSLGGGEYYMRQQDSYKVIRARAELSNNLNTRAAQLSESQGPVSPANGGARRTKHKCRSCQRWFWDWRSRHVQTWHMRNPDLDPVLIDPQNGMVMAQRAV